MSDYIPQSDDKLVTWLTNYKAKIKKNQAALGLTDEEVKTRQDMCDTLIAAIQFSNQQKTALANANKVKSQTKSDVLGTLRSMNNNTKNSSGYTEGIGADLGIIGTSTAFDYATAKPIIAVSLVGGQ